MTARRGSLLAFALTLLLAACANNQGGLRIALNDVNRNNSQNQSGLIIPVQSPARNPAEVAASKAARPFQYREHKPLNLLDFRTNLNPNSNR